MSQVRKKLLAIGILAFAVACLAGLVVYTIRLSVGFIAAPPADARMVSPDTVGPDGVLAGGHGHRTPSLMPQPINLTSASGSVGLAASLVTLAADRNTKPGGVPILLPATLPPAADSAPALVQLPYTAASPIALPATIASERQNAATVAAIPFLTSVQALPRGLVSPTERAARQTDVPVEVQIEQPSTAPPEAAITGIAAPPATAAPQAIAAAASLSQQTVPNATIALASPSAASALGITTLPAGITRPPLEVERELEESQAGNNEKSNITIETGFECSPHMNVRQISPTHFALEVPSQYWFMFKVHGVAVKTIRFDIVNPGAGLRYWSTLNPVYTYATDLNDPATYAVDEKAQAAGIGERAWNGAFLPSTAGQQWHFISHAWQSEDHCFSFVQRFQQDSAVVAMRVPLTPGYLDAATNDRSMLEALSTPNAAVIEVGRSVNDRPLYIVKVSEGTEIDERSRPCIIIYAGEHADEQDGMWVAEGALNYLVGDSQPARVLRKKFTFLVIPMLDPDANISTEHCGIIASFVKDQRSKESVAYANWFRHWVIEGKRLDMVFDLHNVQSKEAPILSCALLEGTGDRGHLSDLLNDAVFRKAKSANIEASFSPWMRGWSPDRLGGWLSREYGCVTAAYEVNSQAAAKHLDINSTKELGEVLVMGGADFLASPSGQSLMSNVDCLRQKLADRRKEHSAASANSDAISSDAEMESGVKSTAPQGQELIAEQSVP